MNANLHREYHAGLDKIIPRSKGTNYIFLLDGLEQAKIWSEIMSYTEKFDKAHSTKLIDALKKVACND